jgi:hypothetical protein
MIFLTGFVIDKLLVASERAPPECLAHPEVIAITIPIRLAEMSVRMFMK